MCVVLASDTTPIISLSACIPVSARVRIQRKFSWAFIFTILDPFTKPQNLHHAQISYYKYGMVLCVYMYMGNVHDRAEFQYWTKQ